MLRAGWQGNLVHFPAGTRYLNMQVGLGHTQPYI